MQGPDIEVLPIGGERLHLEHGLDQAPDVRLEFFSILGAVAICEDEEVDLVLCRTAFEYADDLSGRIERGAVHEPARGIDDTGIDLLEASIVQALGESELDLLFRFRKTL